MLCLFVTRKLRFNTKLCFTTTNVVKVSNLQVFQLVAAFLNMFILCSKRQKNFTPMSAVCDRKLNGKCGFNFEEHMHFNTNGGRQKLPLCV